METISEHPKDIYNRKSVQDNPGKDIFNKICREEHPEMYGWTNTIGNLASAFIVIAIGTQVLGMMNESLRKGGVI